MCCCDERFSWAGLQRELSKGIRVNCKFKLLMELVTAYVLIIKGHIVGRCASTDLNCDSSELLQQLPQITHSSHFSKCPNLQNHLQQLETSHGT